MGMVRWLEPDGSCIEWRDGDFDPLHVDYQSSVDDKGFTIVEALYRFRGNTFRTVGNGSTPFAVMETKLRVQIGKALRIHELGLEQPKPVEKRLTGPELAALMDEAEEAFK